LGVSTVGTVTQEGEKGEPKGGVTKGKDRKELWWLGGGNLLKKKNTWHNGDHKRPFLGGGVGGKVEREPAVDKTKKKGFQIRKGGPGWCGTPLEDFRKRPHQTRPGWGKRFQENQVRRGSIKGGMDR